MMRNWSKDRVLGLACAAALAVPAAVDAQECADDSNQYTRGADVELSWAERPDDPQTKEERYRKALEKLEEAFEANPDLARAWLLAGRSYIGLRRYAAADSALERLAELDPACDQTIEEMRFNAWVPQYNRGIAQLQQGDEAAALEAFGMANTIYDDPRSLASAASIYHQQGQAEKAIRLYSRALEVEGGGEDAEEMVRLASINLAELLRAEGRPEEALEIYSRFAEQNPEDIIGRLNFAIALMDAGQEERAEQLFSELLGRDDLSFRQWSQVGIGLYRAQNFEQAAVAFEKAHAEQPFNKEIQENLANTYYQIEDFDTLVPLADTLVSMYPYEAVHYNMLANARRDLGDPDAALALLEKRNELSIEILRSQLVPQGESTWVVQGQVMNRSAEAGSEVTIPIELLGPEGSVVMTEEAAITLPAQSESAAFQVMVESEDPIAGFRYGLAPIDAGS